MRAEFFRRAADGLEALFGELFVERRIGEDFHDPFVQPGDHGPRRVRRREQPVPGRGLVAGHARLRDRRQLGQSVRALCARDRDRRELPRLYVRHRRRHRREVELDLSRQHVHHRRACALVRHVHDVGAREDAEQLAREMRRAAHARRGEVQRSRLRPCKRGHLSHGSCRRRGMDHQDVRRGRDQAYRRRGFPPRRSARALRPTSAPPCGRRCRCRRPADRRRSCGSASRDRPRHGLPPRTRQGRRASSC